jgi:hypothetical protein
VTDPTDRLAAGSADDASGDPTRVSLGLGRRTRLVNSPGQRRIVIAFVALALMTLGEVRLLERLLYGNRVELDFVARNMAAIRVGRPTFKAWQHRIVAPGLIASINPVTGGYLESVKLLSNLLLAGANLLLFLIMRRKGGNLLASVLAVAVFGFVRLLTLYKVDYPWDGIDVLLFLVFGYWVARAGSFLALTPILLVGTFNHETVLYVPVWYLLCRLDPARRSVGLRKDVRAAALGLVVMGASIFALRHFLYQGPPGLSGQAFDVPIPIVTNILHLRHNLRQLFVDDWTHGRAFMNAGIVSALLLLIMLGAKTFVCDITALTWSGFVVATIFCFGYQSETRLYLPLVAFWFAYAFPVRRLSFSAGPPATSAVTARNL